ncbi:isoflavone reductase [Podospora aff. communis PSN243]|uniref:Isoflavone reductase n=1 Tax=Podospora aff. communis PSN243 TaxID=3040156 RepID=A0AAV9GEJ2_9PEZI|nr:isoflavone reductase [Podospora aff. communis PSN243]
MTIQTVAVVGASGNVGAPTVQALLAAGYTVTAITRPTSTATFPPSVKVLKTDLSSLSSLTSAFQGQDAVVVTTATSEVSAQTILVDAAVAAGVKRFIPSEFGHAIPRLSGGLATILSAKGKVGGYIAEKSKEHPEFSWTAIATSPFFDWGLDHGFWGINVEERTARVVDSGEEVVSTSTLGFVAGAVVAVLQREEETRNKVVEVVEFGVSQKEVLRVLEEEMGVEFKVEGVSGRELGKAGEEKLGKGDVWGAFFDLLLAWNFTDGGDHAVREEELANGWLGLKGQTVREAVREYVKSRTD